MAGSAGWNACLPAVVSNAAGRGWADGSVSSLVMDVIAQAPLGIHPVLLGLSGGSTPDSYLESAPDSPDLRYIPISWSTLL